MSITETQASCLAKALRELIGFSGTGNIAFLRCIPAEIIAPLVSHPAFRVPGWQVFAVAGGSETTPQSITADKAVEIRENKGPATLLIVDVMSAGAGMDGIYSSAKEISEQDLYKKAINYARKGMSKPIAEAVKEAVSRAKKLGQRHTISPWQEFTFYSLCTEKPENIGASLALLGLWPTAFGPEPDVRDISKSALLVEKLLLPPASARAVSARITALMLQGETEAQRTVLEKVIREAGGKALTDVLAKVVAHPEIWLNNIKPSFATAKLSLIELVTWRNRSGGITAWSGLCLTDDEDLPHLILDSTNPASGLAIRWNTNPTEIAKGSVNYEVTIVSASDILATKSVDHGERAPQKTFFSMEDFEELDESAKFQAKVVVRAVDAPDVQAAESEDFIIVFGSMAATKTYRGSGETVRCAVEGAIALDNKDGLVALCCKRAEEAHFRTDSKGYIIIRPSQSGRSFRVVRPPLIEEFEQKWQNSPDAIGRWSLQVRADGSRSGQLTFHPLEGECPEATWSRLVNASRLFCEETMQGPGTLSRVYLHDNGISARTIEYLIAWEGALTEGNSSLALAHTVEVQDVAGKTIGLVVLPSHPVRVAWQAAYDALAIHARYECGMPADKVRKVLKALDSSHFPSMLPGLEPESSFVFADTLGVTAVAMVPDADREPKAAVSTIALCLGAEIPEIAPSVGHQTAAVLSKEIDSYLKYHEHSRFLHLHALRPGDGATVVRALGTTIRQQETGEGEEELQPRLKDLAFNLNIYPSSAQQAVAGRFLTQLSQRRRSGSGGIEKEDAWILDPLPCGGNRTMPRLRWARRDSPTPQEPAHLSLTFDTFVSRVVADEYPSQSSPLHVFGLVASLERKFFFAGETPVWEAWVNPEQDGEKHPTARILTERLNRVHSATLHAVARSLGKPGGWPILHTELNYEEVETLKTLHRLSDWVVTVDRNAGIEYFDSPREAGGVYDSYVIDAVPERDDLGCLQMITSTSHLDEVRGLLDQALSFMGLSSSLRNCEFLLRQLKALSGRLAIRLASATTEAHAKTSGELVALALSRAQCHDPQPGHPCWLSLKDGLFVPLDDVRDLLPAPEAEDGEDGSDTRADLLYVAAPTRGGLTLRFVEVKYRRHLALARSLELVETVSRQTSTSRKLWLDWYFSDSCSVVVRSLRRSKLARALRFYAEKARRHHLASDVFQRLSQEINRMLMKPEDYKLTEVSEPNRGYIFCPEFTPPEPERLFPDISEDTAVFLFGPGALPDVIQSQTPETSEPIPNLQENTHAPSTVATSNETQSKPGSSTTATIMEPNPTESVPKAALTGVILGTVHATDTPVSWSVKIEGNPHLMIVGLPGMGKTTCLVSLCRQLQSFAITPIVFSYHDDIDSKLATFFPDLVKSDCQSLGFNPMRVTDPGPLGHIESAGLLRDIFASIFPELGDLQLEAIRTAIKSSYEVHGWGPQGGSQTPLLPSFRSFFKKLQSSAKMDARTQTLLARLTELDDYMFFNDSPAGQSFLDETRPAVLQIHKTQNAAVQRAYASFAFYRIYQDMFRRGRQDRITHAVIFDEAHRASRLRLIPTMAKECRKYGIALVLASQEARDFDTSLFSAIANYLILRVTENDAKTLARNVAPSDMERRVADRLKQIEKFQAVYFCEGRRNPVHVDLLEVPP